MPDENGYPTDEELNQIKSWDILKDLTGFLEYLESIWWMADWGFELSGKKVLRLKLHTGGWSGNEDIINALAEGALHGNLFWIMYWEKVLRGGHYYFKIKEIK
jgi:hypothetical protein